MRIAVCRACLQRFHAVVTDVADEQSVAALAAHEAVAGRPVHFLFLNAGVHTGRASFEASAKVRPSSGAEPWTVAPACRRLPSCPQAQRPLQGIHCGVRRSVGRVRAVLCVLWCVLSGLALAAGGER